MPVVDSYSETNQDSLGLSLSSTSSIVGQSFIGDGSMLSRVDFFLRKFAAGNTGTLTAYLYAHTNTYGSTGRPADGSSPIATSTNTVDISSLSTTTFALKTFNFDGTFELVDTTPYIVAVRPTTISGIAYAGTDASSPSHSGNRTTSTNGGTNWAGDPTTDLCFYVYSLDPVITAWLTA